MEQDGGEEQIPRDAGNDNLAFRNDSPALSEQATGFRGKHPLDVLEPSNLLSGTAV